MQYYGTHLANSSRYTDLKETVFQAGAGATGLPLGAQSGLSKAKMMHFREKLRLNLALLRVQLKKKIESEAEFSLHFENPLLSIFKYSVMVKMPRF